MSRHTLISEVLGEVKSVSIKGRHSRRMKLVSKYTRREAIIAEKKAHVDYNFQALRRADEIYCNSAKDSPLKVRLHGHMRFVKSNGRMNRSRIKEVLAINHFTPGEIAFALRYLPYTGSRNLSGLPSRVKRDIRFIQHTKRVMAPREKHEGNFKIIKPYHEVVLV